MKYLSTRNDKLKESFLSILFQGLSKDGGLFLPIEWPYISVSELKAKTYQEIAYMVINPYLEDEISGDQLNYIIDKTYKNFNHNSIAPLVRIEKNKYILELFYGPTFAFKDYALQFLGNLFSHVLKNHKKKITVLGATSGDTGSAAINAFKGKEDIEVFILHPYKKISEVQRRQMTTVAENNIHNIAINGTFDDCQKIVKELFVDNELQSETSLTAVNSINWVRLVVQTVYYFWAYAQLNLNHEKINFIVPSGNFGNVFSARIAQYMGLPIDQLHIVTNANDILHRTINEGIMQINKVKQTYSPSMDIQVSSNFERQLFESADRNSVLVQQIMQAFIQTGKQKLKENILSNLRSTYKTHSVSNLDTLETIKLFKNKFNYLADPHTATGLNIINKIHNENPTISLACAHPAKFGDAIKNAIGTYPILPEELENIFDKQEKLTILDNNIKDIKNHILKNL
tara:strand:+ start:160 stop:1533 length:1374 start_codon:yes stop_codon:yes gene_type:complete